MSRGQYETIAVEPLRVPRIMFEELRPESVGHSGSTHWHAGMTGICVLDGVDRQYSDRVDGSVLQFSIHLRIHISPSTDGRHAPGAQVLRPVILLYNCNRGTIRSSRLLRFLDGTICQIVSVFRHENLPRSKEDRFCSKR